LDFFGTTLVIEPSPGQLSSDAGLLAIRQFDERVGLTLDPGIVNEKPRKAGFSRFARPTLVVVQTRRGRPV
jgi:hypothetical protein